MTSLVARVSLGLSSVLRRAGSVLDSIGKQIEVAQYTEKLVPSTRIVGYNGVVPTISEMSFIAPSASVIGDVTVGKQSSVWYGAVVRGDVNKIIVGSNSSIGDRAVIHAAKIQADFPTIIGDNVTIGAGAIIHAATLNDSVLIGEMAQVLDGSVIESKTVIAPASIVTPGTKIPSGELWAGAPAVKVRSLTPDEITNIKTIASETVLLASEHVKETAKTYDQVLEEKELAEIEEAYAFDGGAPPQVGDSDILGQGEPGRIFRSTLTHPEEAFKEINKK